MLAVCKRARAYVAEFSAVINLTKISASLEGTLHYFLNARMNVYRIEILSALEGVFSYNVKLVGNSYVLVSAELGSTFIRQSADGIRLRFGRLR